MSDPRALALKADELYQSRVSPSSVNLLADNFAGPSVASPSEEFCSSTLLFVKDILSDQEFLVDFGASVSVFPGPRLSSDDGVRLLTADRSPMI